MLIKAKYFSALTGYHETVAPHHYLLIN